MSFFLSSLSSFVFCSALHSEGKPGRDSLSLTDTERCHDGIVTAYFQLSVCKLNVKYIPAVLFPCSVKMMGILNYLRLPGCTVRFRFRPRGVNGCFQGTGGSDLPEGSVLRARFYSTDYRGLQFSQLVRIPWSVYFFDHGAVIKSGCCNKFS